MFTAAILAILVSLTLAVARALAGPTAFDRLLAVNMIGSFAVMLLALYGFMSGRAEMFLDVGITYALLNMIGALAVLKFFRYGDLGHDNRPENPDLPGEGR